MHSLAVTSSGELYSWGSGSYGQLGNGARVNRNSPVRAKFTEHYTLTKMVAGKHHSMLLTNEGHVYAFGANNQGQLGLPKKKKKNKKNVEVPTLVSYMTSRKVSDIAAGSFHTAVMIEPYHVFTCGFNKYGQLGLGTTSDNSVFTFVERLKHRNVNSVFAGDTHTWFLLDHDEPYIDDYEMPSPWVFSQRSIEDDNDFTERRVGKKKRRRKGETGYNQTKDRGDVAFPSKDRGNPMKKDGSSKRDMGKKKRRKNRDFDMGDDDDMGKRKKKRKASYFDDEEEPGENSGMYGSDSREQHVNRLTEDRTSEIEEDETEIRTRMNQGEYNEQDPEIMNEERDFEDEMTFSEDEEDEDQESKEKLFDAERINMNERNFFPSKRAGGEMMAVRDLKDSKTLEDSKLSVGKQSTRNMMGGPMRNDIEDHARGMKGVGGVSNERHSEHFSMRPSESVDRVGSHESSMAREGPSTLIMQKNPSGVRMDMRGAQNERISSSFMRPGQSNKNLTNQSNMIEQRSQELDQVEDEDDLELLDDDSLTDSGEDLKRKMEFNQEQVYPPPNRGSKRTTKRRTVDNPQTVTNDLNQMHMNMNESENSVVKRHQSQAANNSRGVRRGRDTPVDSLNITRDLSDEDALDSHEDSNLGEKRFSQHSGNNSNKRINSAFSKNRRNKIGSEYLEGSEVVEEEDDEGDSLGDFEDEQLRQDNMGDVMDIRESQKNISRSQRMTNDPRESQDRPSMGNRGGMHGLNHGKMQGVGRSGNEGPSQRGQLARGENDLWGGGGGNMGNQRGAIGGEQGQNMFGGEQPGGNDTISNNRQGMAGGWGANPYPNNNMQGNNQIDQNYDHKRSINTQNQTPNMHGNAMGMRGQDPMGQDMVGLRDNQRDNLKNMNANSSQNRHNIVYNIHNTHNIGVQDPRNQMIGDVNRRGNDFGNGTPEEVEDLMDSRSKNETQNLNGAGGNKSGGFGMVDSLHSGQGDKGRSTRTDNQDFSSGKEEQMRKRNLDEVHGIQKANTGIGMKSRNDKVVHFV